MADTKPTQVAKCKQCSARYDTSSMEPGKLFNCKHCGHILQAPGVKEVQTNTIGALGEVAVDLGYITPHQLEEALALHQKTEKRLGDILVAKGWLKSGQLKKILEMQGANVANLIPGYEIVQKLGQGGMGAVYKALHVKSGRTVAIKVLDQGLASRDILLERFHREARTAIKLDHPHIVKGYEEGAAGDAHFFAMEYIHGKSIGRVLKKRKSFGEKRSLDVIRQIAKALDHASENGVVHRDIKPDNIMIDRSGKVKLADYGLVKFADDIGEAVLTTEGQVMGTPKYISPEQAAGSKDIDIRTDIYSLGATLFHLLTGEPPFKGPGLSKTLKQHIKSPVPDLREIKPELSVEACAICKRMLEKIPADRYQMPKDLLADIRAYFLQVNGKTTGRGISAMNPIVGDSDPGRSSSADVGIDALNSTPNVELADPVAETIDFDDDFVPLYRHPLVIGGMAFVGGLAAVLVLVSMLPGWIESIANGNGATIDLASVQAEAPAINMALLLQQPSATDLQAARLLQNAFQQTGRDREDLLLRIDDTLSGTSVAAVMRPKVTEIRQQRKSVADAARKRQEEEIARKQEALNQESTRAFNKVMRENTGDALEQALANFPAKYKDTKGGTRAAEEYQRVKTRREEFEASKAKRIREEKELQRRTEEQAIEARVAPVRHKFLLAYRRLLAAGNYDRAEAAAEQLADQSRYPDLYIYGENCLADVRALIRFTEAVEEAFKNQINEEVTIETLNGSLVTGRLLRIQEDGRLRIRSEGKFITPKQIFGDLSLGTLITFYNKEAKAGDAPAALALAIYSFARKDDPKVVVERFRAALAEDPRKEFHESLLHHTRILPAAETLE